MKRIHHSNCPLCGSGNIHYSLTVKDHTVSAEFFKIDECEDCSGRFTQDAPDMSEIGKYYQSPAYVSHTNTREGIVNRLYHRVRKITLNQKKKIVQQQTGLQKGRLLDIGAGTGLFVDTMVKAGWVVTGLEPDEGARGVASGINIKLEDLSNLFSLQPASLDAITLWHVLEHVHELHRYLRQFGKLLRESGKLIIAVPNYTSGDAKHYREYWAAYDVPRHLYHFSPAAMKHLLEKHGFSVVKIYAQWFDSFYVSLLSEQYKSGKPGLIKGGWMGFISNLNAAFNRKECSSLIYVAQHGGI
jgi:SAM-dependent methyltransferase